MILALFMVNKDRKKTRNMNIQLMKHPNCRLAPPLLTLSYNSLVIVQNENPSKLSKPVAYTASKIESILSTALLPKPLVKVSKSKSSFSNDTMAS